MIRLFKNHTVIRRRVLSVRQGLPPERGYKVRRTIGWFLSSIHVPNEKLTKEYTNIALIGPECTGCAFLISDSYRRVFLGQIYLSFRTPNILLIAVILR